MKRYLKVIGMAGLLVGASTAAAADGRLQGPQTGPVVDGLGPVFEVPGAFGLAPGQRYRAVMDVAGASGAADDLNRELESAARYLNMHARAGVDRADLELVVVLHGGATDAALNDAAYRARHGVANPNRALLTGLAAAGVRLYLCGQSAGFRGIAPAELADEVELATSAMTALVRLQSEGYALLP